MTFYCHILLSNSCSDSKIRYAWKYSYINSFNDLSMIHPPSYSPHFHDTGPIQSTPVNYESLENIAFFLWNIRIEIIWGYSQLWMISCFWVEQCCIYNHIKEDNMIQSIDELKSRINVSLTVYIQIEIKSQHLSQS